MTGHRGDEGAKSQGGAAGSKDRGGVQGSEAETGNPHAKAELGTGSPAANHRAQMARTEGELWD